jgi:NAD(P)H-flavin reductase
VVWVRGPYGQGWEVDDAVGGDLLLAAGGIGLAPLRPVIRHVLAERERFGLVTVVYGSRTPDQLLFLPELESWRGRFDLDVAVTVDAATAGWKGHVGLVTSALPREGVDGVSLALVCGPEIMMRLTADALVTRGLGPERVRVSLERNMQCGVCLCGHCQLREVFVCRDGPVLDYARARPLLTTREL